MFRCANADPLFPGPNHSRLTRSGVAKLLARYVRAVRARDPGWAPGLPVAPHTLRRTRAMHLIEAGVNLIYIRDLLGHASISSTESTRARTRRPNARRSKMPANHSPRTPCRTGPWTCP
jgi:integrase/recombinase XerD